MAFSAGIPCSRNLYPVVDSAKDSVVPSYRPKRKPDDRKFPPNGSNLQNCSNSCSHLYLSRPLGRQNFIMARASSFNADQIGLSFFADSLTFLFSALMILFIAIPQRSISETSPKQKPRLDLSSTIKELKVGNLSS